MRVLAVLCCLMLAAPAQASGPTTWKKPTPGPLTSLWSSPLAAILKLVDDDLKGAIAVANAMNPPDTLGAQCYQSLLDMKDLIQNTNGILNGNPAIVTTYEQLFALSRELKKLQTTDACPAVCGRAATIIAIYGVALTEVCTALGKL